MKRSEPVLIIAECLIEPHFPDDPMKQASVILSKLEKLGIIHTTYHGYYGNPNMIGNDPVIMEGWEPENEE